MAALTPQDGIKKTALIKLEQYLKEYFSYGYVECPLKSFDFTLFKKRFSEEELYEISPITKKLLCTWELKKVCDLRDITIICPHTSKECNFRCGT